jgi:hypothetical protein
MSTLDEILDSKAKSEDEKSNASTGISLLFDILEQMNEAMNESMGRNNRELQRYREYVFHIETKTNYLLLIIIRLRELAKSRFFVSSGVHTKTVDYFLIGLESFFHYAISILDLVARLTPYFYPSAGAGFKKQSKHFSWQKNWFIDNDNTALDFEYKENIIKRTCWFSDLNDHRGNLTHDTSIFFCWGQRPPKLFFGTKRNDRDFIPNQDALEYVNKTANGLIEFLLYFNSYFSKKR